MANRPMHPSLVQLRAEMPVVENCIYFQTGSLGPLSTETLQAIRQAAARAAAEGPASPEGLDSLVEAGEQARAALARLLNAPPAQIGWSANTSQAMRLVVRSLQLSAADRILTSDQEHVATRSLYDGLRDALGLSVEILPTMDGDEPFLAALEAALQTPWPGRTLVLLSHVSCIDGRILPVTEAVERARRYGAISLIDGAQAVGQIPVDLRAIDPDFYLGSLHKWLLGPSGIGYFYLRAPQLTEFNPNWRPARERAGNDSAAWLGEAGTADFAQRVGAGVALARMHAIGMATVAAHGHTLRAQLRAGLCEFPGVTLLGPDDAARTTGLVGFTVRGWDADDCRNLVERLYAERRILIKYQPERTGLRVSLAAFNAVEDVAALLSALADEWQGARP